ncbi:unnamed protein product [Sphagnum troendelagicum]|uniref:Uncharacterized protein n=1 Tax=Sphagnum jensenii TaxID=128206 RepID=A0ABP0WGR8_9BRYO
MRCTRRRVPGLGDVRPSNERASAGLVHEHPSIQASLIDMHPSSARLVYTHPSNAVLAWGNGDGTGSD